VNSREAEDLVIKGIAALENEHTHLALVCFERAAELGENPTIGSGLGYCVAAARGEVEKGLALCREAIAREPDNVFHYRNLGSVLLLAGNSHEAIEVFREGLRIRQDEGIIRKLDSLGTRKPPIFKSLSRKHFLNRTLGLLMDRLGFR
jgi:tetratricopeptide (TPR) repeat protein